jgi:uncharacterized protein (DUF4415 family)
MPRKPNSEWIDHENPEADAEWFNKARPAKEVLAQLVGDKSAENLLKPKRGRPPLPNTKRHINLRIDEDIISAFQQSGQGWQTRMNLALREWLKTQPINWL